MAAPAGVPIANLFLIALVLVAVAVLLYTFHSSKCGKGDGLTVHRNRWTPPPPPGIIPTPLHTPPPDVVPSFANSPRTQGVTGLFGA